LSFVRLTALLFFSIASLPAQIAASSIQLPVALAYDAAGNLYFADANRHQIFEATLGGQLLLVAGSGTQGFAGDGSAATAAQLNAPQALAIGADGTIYLADTSNNVIRAVSNGVIATIAGTGKAAFSGDGGPAIAASLAEPNALALDSSGALLIADSGNHRIRRVSNGIITTVAGNGTQGFSGDGFIATAAQLDTPSGIALGASGSLFISDTHNHRIRVVDSTGIMNTFAGTGKPGFSGDNGPSAAAQLDSPKGLAIINAGVLLIADANNQRIRSIDSQSVITTLAGNATQGSAADGTIALAAALNTPQSLAINSFGYLAIADAPNHVVRILTADGKLYLPDAFTNRTSTVTLTAASNATIAVAGQAAIPQGVVQLLADGAAFATVTLTSGTATVPLTALAPGSHTLTALYSGDGLNPAANSSALTISTAKATTAVVTAPPSPNDFAGMPLLLNANVTSVTKGTPTGTVNFIEAGTTVASAQLAAGIASGAYLAPAAGTHTIIANYLGDNNFSPSAASAVIATVKPMPDFTLATTGSTSQTIAAGSIATYTLSITPQSGAFTGAVSLSASGLPFGATVSFSPPQLVPGASSTTCTMSIQTLASVVKLRSTPGSLYALLCLPLLLLRRRSRRLLPICGLIVIAGCGTRINQPPTPAAASYPIIVSATGTNLAGAVVVHTTTVTLTIE
jgi:sugar lactone lactonase YvrE